MAYRAANLLGVWLVAAAGGGGLADEPAVAVLADFEDASVAAQVAEVKNVLAGDCRVERVSIPARGQGSLAVEIGSTARHVSVACDLTFREATRFRQADRVATFCWINAGEIGLGFRIRDARDQLFETPTQPVQLPHRWVYVASDLKPENLRRVRGDGPLTYPIEVEGYRVTTDRLGKQTVYLDDLQVEQRVRPQDLIHGEFEFDEPTRIYEPGSSVAAAVVLENRSRERTLSASVELAWMRPDGSVLQTQRADVSLPASGVDFRSHRKLDFSQRIREPGLYRLLAQARAPGWTSPNTVETAIAVTPSNRGVSRGRSTFFGVLTNLLREPELDQMLEVRVARDVGVNLLALDAPWRQLEPKQGAFDFRRLELVIDALKRRNVDMAALLVLTDPPEWLPAAASSRSEAAAALINGLCTHFGERLVRFQLDAAVLACPTTAARLDAARAVRERVGPAHPKVEVLPPPIMVADGEPAFDLAAFLSQNADFPLVFQTVGDSSAALEKLETFRQRGAFEWRVSDWWMHRAEPVGGAGHYADAEDLLRHYVKAAASGVGGLIWFDLRDDDNDPAFPDMLRGLVRRDFSPKTSLLGYAAAAGQLTGHRYAGPVSGTPDFFESALFIGGTRQVAVLLPRPNRALPAVLVPVSQVPGEFQVQDFERRERPLLRCAAPALVTTIPRPLFVTLTLKAAQSEPQLVLAHPWLRVPRTVFCGSDTEFSIEVDVLAALQRSYLQVRLPKNAPLTSSLSSLGLRGEVGETVRTDVRLTPKPGQEFERAELPLRVALEGDTLELPLEVRPLVDVRPLMRGEKVASPAFRIAQLAAAGSRPVTAKATLYCGYSHEGLHVAVVVEDDKLVPHHADKSGLGSGDELLLGIAREGSNRHAEARLNPAGDPLTPEPLSGTSRKQLEEWSCEVEAAKGEGPQTCHVVVPSRSLGDRELAAGDRILLAVRYVDGDGDGLPRVALQWGDGLNGSRSTTDYRWLRLTDGVGR